MIKRIPRKTKFTVMPNQIINDDRLDWKELGLLCYLLSKPDHWETHPSQLIKQKVTGRKGLYSILKNLSEYGYMGYHRSSDGSTEWFVTEEPYADNGDVAEKKPHAPKPHLPKPHLPKGHGLVSTDLVVNTDKEVKTDVGQTVGIVISYLNLKTGHRFQPGKENSKLITALLADYSVEEMMSVIDSKCAEWIDTDFQKFLRPSTLFRASKFREYLGMAHVVPQAKELTADEMAAMIAEEFENGTGYRGEDGQQALHGDAALLGPEVQGEREGVRGLVEEMAQELGEFQRRRCH